MFIRLEASRKPASGAGRFIFRRNSTNFRASYGVLVIVLGADRRRGNIENTKECQHIFDRPDAPWKPAKGTGTLKFLGSSN